MNLMQASTQAPPAGAVIAQGPPSPKTITVTGADGKPQTLQIPTTHDEMQQLMSRRSQLADQLDNVTDRRNGIVEQLQVAPNVAQPGLTAQLKVLNDRIVQLETDLAATGRQIASASPEVMSMAEEPPRGDDNGSFEDGVGAGVAGSVVVVTVMLFLFRRRLRRRGPGRTPQLSDDASPRLARLEQGMDAIAIEVERISEGQRFVTRLLSESRGAPAPAERSAEQTTLKARDQAR